MLGVGIPLRVQVLITVLVLAVGDARTPAGDAAW